MVRNIFVSLLFLNFFMFNANAEEAFTWEDCLNEARQNHSDLISAKEELNQAMADKTIVKSASLPQITGTLSGKTAKATTGVTTDTYAYDITGKQLLFDGFKSVYEISSASEDVKSARYNYDVASSNVRLSLRTAFVGLVKAQQLLDITKDISGRRKQNLELVKLRYEAGREHKGSLLTSQADLARAEFEVAQAERNISLMQRQLSNELGRKDFTSISVKGELEVGIPGNEKPVLESLAKENPFLLELIARKESARFGVKSAKAELFPEMYATASTGKSDAHWPARSGTWSAGVSLSLPVFEGGSRIAEISKSQAKFHQAQADEISGRDSVILTLEETWKEWQDSIDMVEVEKQFLEAAEERAKITQAQYSIGLVSFDDWSIIEDNLAETKKSFLNAKANALITEARWIQAKGGTLDYVEK